MSVGVNIPRVDAYEKVTGRAMYTDDLVPSKALVAKIVRSTIAHGKVKSFDLEKASRIPGVVRIFTCFDVPENEFMTSGHPYSLDPAHQDVSDRKLLNTHVRIYGDDIAVVVAENELAAIRATKLVKVEYEEYPVYVGALKTFSGDTPILIHDGCASNLLAHSSENDFYHDPTMDIEKATKKYEKYLAPPMEEVQAKQGCNEESQTVWFRNEYKTQAVQHCPLESVTSFAWMEDGRAHVVSPSQIPHMVRHIISQATGLPIGKIRVVKPYLGGGFGNKQDALYEPLNVWLSMKLGGRCVQLQFSREETMTCTRIRHPIEFQLFAMVSKEPETKGLFISRNIDLYSEQGGYASQGHSIAINAANVGHLLYQSQMCQTIKAWTVYTNISSGGAFRGYGIPQIVFAMESFMDDIALKLDMDPIALRMMNALQPGYVEPASGTTCYAPTLRECVERGKEFIGWDEKRKAYKNQSGSSRRGVGMGMFCYKTGIAPFILETAACRIIMNQDGTVQIQMGAVEVGQGSDTMFTQMAAESLGIPCKDITVISQQDTDISPFDTGAYASRQSYVSGMALKKTAALFKDKVLTYAAEVLNVKKDTLDVVDANIVNKENGEVLRSLSDIALEAFYSMTHSEHITAELTHQCHTSTMAYGACFAEVEVDIPVGKVEILNIINVHDSGTIINLKTAQGQVHGGMSMSIGYALSEELLFDENAKPLNGNFLDYKIPTAMDTPDLHTDFVQEPDPTGPFGNKGLGEPPAIPSAPAIRNAILNATGVGINALPMNPQNLVTAFVEAGLIDQEVK